MFGDDVFAANSHRCFLYAKLAAVVHFSILGEPLRFNRRPFRMRRSVNGRLSRTALLARALGSGLFQVLDWINGLDAETIVPGHGPLGTKKRISQMREYVDILKREVKKRFDASFSAIEATVDIRRDL
jgi:hypothetical protein